MLQPNPDSSPPPPPLHRTSSASLQLPRLSTSYRKNHPPTPHPACLLHLFSLPDFPASKNKALGFWPPPLPPTSPSLTPSWSAPDLPRPDPQVPDRLNAEAEACITVRLYVESAFLSTPPTPAPLPVPHLGLTLTWSVQGRYQGPLMAATPPWY